MAKPLGDIQATVIGGNIIPRNVIVETIFGCNSSCTMCPINLPTRRKKGLMSEETFKKSIDGLSPCASEIAQIDLFGVGEPFLDKGIQNRVRDTKSKGFKDVGFATNADLMTPELAQGVFEAGLDTIMISLDGASAGVHEAIRVGTNFSRIVQNVKSAIALRDNHRYKTKFVMRFIRQACNAHEWPLYQEYWKSLLSQEKGDLIIGYDLHSWGGEIDATKRRPVAAVPPQVPCHHIFDRLIILNDGSVTMCCADMHSGRHIMGNVHTLSALEIFNSASMTKLRNTHLHGRRLSIKLCADCTILESESAVELK